MKHVPCAVTLWASSKPPVRRWVISWLHPARLSTSLRPMLPPRVFTSHSLPGCKTCVLARWSESRPCGSWWLSLGLTPVTTTPSGVNTSLTLRSWTWQKAWKRAVALLRLPARRRHFQTRTHTSAKPHANKQIERCLFFLVFYASKHKEKVVSFLSSKG